MSRHAPLTSLLIEHDFFVSSRCSALNCEPDPGTVKLARDCELVLKPSPYGVTVYFDQARSNALELAAADPTSPPELWFRLTAVDQTFANCTELSTSDDKVLLFSNAADRPDVLQERQSLAKGVTVSEDDLVELNDEALEKVLTPRDRRLPPVAFVCIALTDLTRTLHDVRPASPDEQLPVLRGLEPAHFVLRFKARETFWRYNLLGDMARPAATIVDLSNGSKGLKKIEFNSDTQTRLADNRPAISLTSNEKIPLRQHSDRHFQLKENGAGILVKRLPAASADRLYLDQINGEFVSDIYINC